MQSQDYLQVPAQPAMQAGACAFEQFYVAIRIECMT